MNEPTSSIWPKIPPLLTAEQQAAREKFMMLWHQILPKRYRSIERFNHGFVANLPLKPGSKTLEIGAGLGAHAKYEDLTKQQYYCLDYREEFCRELKKVVPPNQVRCGDIQKK